MPSLDSDLHQAINILQIIVLRLEMLKNQDTSIDGEVNDLIQRTIDCSALLRDARRETQSLVLE